MHDNAPASLRILIKGNSLVTAMSEWNQTREHKTFPRVLEETLAERGHRVEVVNRSFAGGVATALFEDWERDVHVWRPDVVITTYGEYECMHGILPRWLERHANNLNKRPGPVRGFYRKHLIGPAWQFLAKVQQKVDRVLRDRLFGKRAETVAGQLEEFVHRSRKVGKPLILQFELLPPGPRGNTWFPGMASRLLLMNAAFGAMVARLDDPEVRIFPVSTYAAAVDAPDGNPVPDGFHYIPVLHELIGRALADEISAWAATPVDEPVTVPADAAS